MRVGASWRFDPCSNIEFKTCSDQVLLAADEVYGSGISAGDSGGPLFSDRMGEWRVIGVASYGRWGGPGFKGGIWAPVAASFEQAKWIMSMVQLPFTVPSVRDFGLFGVESMKINDRALVWGDVGGATVEVGASATLLGDGYAEESAWARSLATVTGRLQAYNVRSNQAAVGEDVREPAILPTQLDEFTQCKLDQILFPESAADQIVPNDGAATLSPGEYGSVVLQARSTLNLEAGTYSFDSLNIEPDATLVVPPEITRIAVREGLTMKGSVEGSDPQSLLFAHVGASGVHIQGDMIGTIVAPRSGVEIQSERSYVGQVLARSVEVHQDAVFTAAPFAYAWDEEGRCSAR